MGTLKKEQFLFLQALWNILDLNSGKFLNLYRIVFDDKILFIAYNEISQKKNCFTPINFKKFKIIAKKLRFSKYKKSASKKMLLLNKTITHSLLLTVMSMIDKIIVYSVYMILSCIYKGNRISAVKRNNLIVDYRSRFLLYTSTQSNKSIYSLLNDIRTWVFCLWFVTLDAEQFSEKINRQRFFNILREVIEDPRVFHFIQCLGVSTFFIAQIKKSITKEIGRDILRSNMLGCLFASVYFCKLDGFVCIMLKESWLENNKPKLLSAKLRKHWFFFCVDTNELNNTIKKHKKKKTFQRDLTYPKVLQDKAQTINLINCRVYFARYLNKIMFGIRGSKSLASLIEKECKFFILNNLYFNLRVTNLYSAKTDEVKYLGFVVKSLSDKMFNNKKILRFNRAKNKKQILLRKWQYPLNFSFKNKVALRVSEMLGYVVKKVLLNKIIDKVNYETLIIMIAKITESIFFRYQKKIGILKYHLNSSNQRFVLRWYSNALFCSKFNWVHRRHLNKIFGRHSIMRDSVSSLQNLSEGGQGNTLVPFKRRKFQQVEIKSVSEHFIVHVVHIAKQSIKLRLFSSKSTVLHKLKQWGMIDKKRNKPIACNYMNGKFVACFKI
jgi:hypothetical protein